MSAWLCSDKHIFELAKYYVENCQFYSYEKMSFREAAKELYNENCNSLLARYGDEYPPIKVPANYVPTIDNIFVMAKQVNCYEYQSCEHDGWEDSKAHAMCRAIKESLLTKNDEYENAPWGID